MNNPFEDMKQQLKHGVKVVSSDQLFITPMAVASRMVEYANIDENSRVLEPSAGTGVIITCIERKGAEICAVEINGDLAGELMHRVNHLRQDDFLECGDELGKFDAVVMNPPFKNASDIKHILHAYSMLKEGGRLVAICADGSRQNEKLKPLAERWEQLPAGTFRSVGTNVNTALMVLVK